MADSPQQAATLAIERLRLAESRLSRRRQSDCGPSDNARAALRFVLESADVQRDVTPTAIAEHLGVSTASVTGLLDKLHSGGLIGFEPNPRDRRSKLVVPFSRAVDIEDVEPMTGHIRKLVAELSAKDALVVKTIIDLVADRVDDECR